MVVKYRGTDPAIFEAMGSFAEHDRPKPKPRPGGKRKGKGKRKKGSK